MQNDIIIDQQQAEAIQQAAQQNGQLVIWVVTWNTSDYPDHAVSRPNCVDSSGIQVLNHVLVGESLDAVRDQLPEGLTRMERHPDDDVVIIETWI